MILAPATDSAALVLRERSSEEIRAVVFARAAEDAPWQPFANYVRRGERVRFTSLAGLQVSCKT
jgi:hypothetical protein